MRTPRPNAPRSRLPDRGPDGAKDRRAAHRDGPVARIALALAVHALAMEVFYGHGDSVLKLRLTQRGLRPAIREHQSCPALLALEAERERITAMLPEDGAALWSWCLNAGQGELLDKRNCRAAARARPEAGEEGHRGAQGGPLRPVSGPSGPKKPPAAFPGPPISALSRPPRAGRARKMRKMRKMRTRHRTPADRPSHRRWPALRRHGQVREMA